MKWSETHEWNNFSSNQNTLLKLSESVKTDIFNSVCDQMVTLRLQWDKEEKKKNQKFVPVHNIQAVQSMQIIDPVLYFSLSPSGVAPFFSAAAEQCGKLEIKMQRMKEGWRGGGDGGTGGRGGGAQRGPPPLEYLLISLPKMTN